MTSQTVSLNAESAYGNSGQYVARITGRDSKFTFAREFIGRKEGKRGESSSADVDEPGLYMECDVGKRGKDETYYVVYDCPGAGLIKTPVERTDMMAFAKEPTRAPDEWTRVALEYRLAFHEAKARSVADYKLRNESTSPDVVALKLPQLGLPAGELPRTTLIDALRAALASTAPPATAPAIDLSVISTEALEAELARRART